MTKQALISTVEPRYTGYRVAQVVASKADTFEVGEGLFWADCADDVVADQFWYNPDNQLIEPNLMRIVSNASKSSILQSAYYIFH